VVDLTKPQFDGWKASLVKKSENKEGVRKSKDTANRVLTMLKAFLNHAWNDEKNAGLAESKTLQGRLPPAEL